MELTFCLVDVASFISGTSASMMTGVPYPEANEMLSIGLVFS